MKYKPPRTFLNATALPFQRALPRSNRTRPSFSIRLSSQTPPPTPTACKCSKRLGPPRRPLETMSGEAIFYDYFYAIRYCCWWILFLFILLAHTKGGGGGGLAGHVICIPRCTISGIGTYLCPGEGQYTPPAGRLTTLLPPLSGRVHVPRPKSDPSSEF